MRRSTTHPGEAVFDELVAMTESSLQQPGCSQNLLGVVSDSIAKLQPREGRAGELRGGGPGQEPCLSLRETLPWPNLCINNSVKKAGVLFTSAKIYTREN